ncbi:hypothetical protein AB4142_24090 [Variovorax sp. 2RAF20]
MNEERVALNSDASEVTLHLDGKLSAHELEDLIHRLAELRAAMNPAVPDTRAAALAANSAMLEEDRPSITAAVRLDGSLRISMRNRGIGWVAAIVERRTAHALGRYMVEATPEVQPLDLINHSERHRH